MPLRQVNHARQTTITLNIDSKTRIRAELRNEGGWRICKDTLTTNPTSLSLNKQLWTTAKDITIRMNDRDGLQTFLDSVGHGDKIDGLLTCMLQTFSRERTTSHRERRPRW